jgi:hypothetical protein
MRFQLRAAHQREGLPVHTGMEENSVSSPFPLPLSMGAASPESEERTVGGRDDEQLTGTLRGNYELQQENDSRWLSRVRCFSRSLHRLRNNGNARQPESVFNR